MDNGPSPKEGNAGDNLASRSGIGSLGSFDGRVDSFAPGLQAKEFCVLQQTRQILVGTEGAVAQVRCRGSVRHITHSHLGTEPLRDAVEVRLLSVGSDGVTLWARREDAITGVYRLDARGLHVRTRLREIRPDVRSFGRHMLVSGLRQGDPGGHVRYVTDLEDFPRAERDLVSLTSDGEVIVLAKEDTGGTVRWVHSSLRDGRLTFRREIGDCERISVMRWRGEYCYTQDFGGHFRIWAPHDGSINRTFKEEHGLPFPARCWSSPDGETILHLVRYDGLPERRPSLAAQYGPRYELFINGKEAPQKEGFHRLDGYVWEPTDPRTDDHFKLEWSPLGRAWALRVYIRRMASDGVPFISERLITSAGRVMDVPEVCNLHEWVVDEEGHPVAYVLSDGHTRRLYVHGALAAEHPFILGLALEEDSVTAHVADGRSISRKRFQL